MSSPVDAERMLWGCSCGRADEQRRELTPLKLRRKARDFALKAVKAQRDQFKRCAAPCLLAL